MSHEFSLDDQQGIITGVQRDDQHRTQLVQLNGEIIDIDRLRLYMRSGLKVYTLLPQPEGDPVLTKVILRTDGVVMTDPNGTPIDNLDNLGPLKI